MMRPPYLRLAAVVVVGMTGGAILEASRSTAAPALVEEVSGDTTTSLCIVSITGAKIAINCTTDDVVAYLKRGAK